MLLLQNHYNCHNINLVTPTHFVPNILDAVFMAAQKGLSLPQVYNCGGYESLETLELLDGVVDIYMPSSIILLKGEAAIPRWRIILKR